MSGSGKVEAGSEQKPVSMGGARSQAAFGVMFLATVFGAFLTFLVYHIAGPGWPTLTIGLPIGLTVTIGLWPTAKRKRAWLLRMTPEVWIGRDGLVLFGKYTGWFGPETFLKAARIDGGELALDLWSRETGTEQIRVPIPPGEASAAVQVALKLTELCAQRLDTFMLRFRVFIGKF